MLFSAPILLNLFSLTLFNSCFYVLILYYFDENPRLIMRGQGQQDTGEKKCQPICH